MSNREKHREKLRLKERQDKLARGLGAGFQKFCNENAEALGGSWNESREKVAAVVARFLTSRAPLSAKNAKLIAEAVVTQSANRVVVDIRRLAGLLLKVDERRKAKKGAAA